MFVTDQGGNVSEATSERPFFIVAPNLGSVRTLIVHNVARMQSPEGGGIDSVQAGALLLSLKELADHPRVQGWLVDLGGITALEALYEAWDASPADADLANLVKVSVCPGLVQSGQFLL